MVKSRDILDHKQGVLKTGQSTLKKRYVLRSITYSYTYVNVGISSVNHIICSTSYRKKRKVNAINFCMGFGGCVKCKSYLIFKILLMLMECRILLMGNTVEMAGGDINTLRL